MKKYIPISLGFNLSNCFIFGYLNIYTKGFFSNKFIEHFVVLCDIGLLIFNLPLDINPIPCKFVNLLGADLVSVSNIIKLLYLFSIYTIFI